MMMMRIKIRVIMMMLVSWLIILLRKLGILCFIRMYRNKLILTILLYLYVQQKKTNLRSSVPVLIYTAIPVK